YRPDDFWLVVASTRIAVDHDNVKWIATSRGIVSYSGGPDDNGPTEVTKNGIMPDAVRIIGNYPNPFNPRTTIEFTLPSYGIVNLAIYNITGQKVRELVSESMSPGTHSVTWDGSDDNGVSVSSGIYVSHIMMGKHTAAGSMVLMR
ncbi:unnamed protein product, partial [marine sediment metagenome]